MIFDADLSLAELDAFEILCSYHLRQMKMVGDKKTCLLFATKLGTLKGMCEYAAAQMAKERLCQCGTIIKQANVKKCPGCGRELC